MTACELSGGRGGKEEQPLLPARSFAMVPARMPVKVPLWMPERMQG